MIRIDHTIIPLAAIHHDALFGILGAPSDRFDAGVFDEGVFDAGDPAVGRCRWLVIVIRGTDGMRWHSGVPLAAASL